MTNFTWFQRGFFTGIIYGWLVLAAFAVLICSGCCTFCNNGGLSAQDNMRLVQNNCAPCAKERN